MSFAVTGSAGLALVLLFRTRPLEISHREGFMVVTLTWLSSAFFGSLPFVLSGHFSSFVDALFESTSGFTTTGASVLTDVTVLPHGVLFWRSLTHWLGGMGIVVLSLAILPLLGIGGMQLYKAEASSVVAGEKFAPRVREMARILLAVYLIISFTEVLFLTLGGMNLYDSFIHTFGTVATGGFSNRVESVAYYNSPYIEAVITIFMILGATNFALHYRLFQDGPSAYLKNEEFRFYIFVMTISTVAVTINISGLYNSLVESFRYASFQVISIMTTTGFSTADFSLWPPFSQILLLVLMFFGGSAGSTSGTIKCIRLLLLFKIGYREVYRLVHPHAVTPIKLGGKVVPQDVITGVTGFTLAYISVFVVSSVILASLGIDPLVSISASATTIGNIGPGLGFVGPAGNYSAIPELGKWVLILDMLLGRLEVYTFLILLLPAFWRG